MAKRKEQVEEVVEEKVEEVVEETEPKSVVELKSDSKGKYYEKLFRGGK